MEAFKYPNHQEKRKPSLRKKNCLEKKKKKGKPVNQLLL